MFKNFKGRLHKFIQSINEEHHDIGGTIMGKGNPLRFSVIEILCGTIKLPPFPVSRVNTSLIKIFKQTPNFVLSRAQNTFNFSMCEVSYLQRGLCFLQGWFCCH